MGKRNSSIVGFIVIILILAVLAFAYPKLMKFMPSKDRLDMKRELNIKSENEYAICLNGKYMEEFAYKVDGQLYLPVSFVKKFINKRFYFNNDDEHLLYSLSDKTLELDYEIIENEPYMKLKDVTAYTQVGALEYKENIIGINTIKFIEDTEAVTVKKNNHLRKKGGIKSPILFDVEKDEIVFIVEDLSKWVKAVTVDGRLGYLQKSKLDLKHKKDLSDIKHLLEIEDIKEVFDNQVRKHKICLGWHLMTNRAGNSKLEKIVSESPAMNVISPTWFSVKDNEGNLESFADRDYVKKAHSLGLEVWGLIGDINYKEAKAKVFLHHFDTRKKIIDGIIDLALEVGMDGINLDFESIPKDSGEDFIQFVRELSIECRKNALVLSVDNYVPKNFNMYFNRDEQGVFADYVVIMGYDEHYSGSKEAGSVASLEFVKNGMDKTLEEVPKEKVINGVPAYMRVWTHTQDGLKAKSLSMHQAKALIETYNLEPEFDEATCQSYAEYTNEKGNFCQVWFEDKESLNKKMDAILERDIAGVAIWRLGLETSDTWDVFKRINEVS